MKKFSDWLDSNPGMQQKLAKTLKTNKTCPSLVKHERRPLPRRWIPVVIEMSNGLFSADELLHWSIHVSNKLSARRREQATSA